MAYNQLDIYHRAFKAYKKELKREVNDNKFLKAICRASLAQECLKTVRYSCDIELDWIEFIESHLGYIENAILENRQFILQQGETLLIEKAKRVSKASVEHLAQHSEMITHLPEPGGDIIPDKIYVVENDSNFAVYENRFLYMLLLELTVFVDDKYTKIIDLWDKYSSDLQINKTVAFGKRKISFRMSVNEDSHDDPDTSYNEDGRQSLERIRDIQRTLAGFLNTPLMREVSRSPLIKPPITRTNVLKMDTNFKMAVELYDFISSYEKDGYVVHEFKEDIDGFDGPMSEDFAEMVALSSYLSYRYGAMLNSTMEQRYDNETNRRRIAEDEEFRLALSQMQAELKAGKISAEKYTQALEKRNVVLEKDRDMFNAAESDLAQYKHDMLMLSESCESLTRANEQLDGEVRNQQKITREQAAQFESELKIQKRQHEAEMAELKAKYDELEQLQLSTMAQLRGIRRQHGVAEEDCSSQQMLVQLEREREAFDKMFAEQWKRAKAKIRKKAFGRSEKATDTAKDSPNKD